MSEEITITPEMQKAADMLGITRVLIEKGLVSYEELLRANRHALCLLIGLQDIELSDEEHKEMFQEFLKDGLPNAEEVDELLSKAEAKAGTEP